ncbi:MAG: hypothetical protein NTX25_08230, partial [Proteobacteria bacterium]|nr:hypothetical protein [Pseudomonadota bacterium]
MHLSHLRVQFCLLGLALALITTSCSKSNLTSKPIKASSPTVSVPTSEAPKNQTEDQDTAAKTEASPAIVNKVDDAQNGKKSAVVELPSNVDQNGNLNACPSANQTILILDLKS